MRTNLKLLRVKHNFSQEKMAAKIGCTRGSYQAIESGNRQGGKTFWRKLQLAFNIDDVDMWALQKDE